MFNFISFSMNLQILNVEFCKVGDWWNFQNIISPYYRIYFIVAGEAEITLNDTKFCVKIENKIIIPANTRHSVRCYDTCDVYFVHFYINSNIDINILTDYEYLTTSIFNNHELNVMKRLLEINPMRKLNDYNPFIALKNACKLNTCTCHERQNNVLDLETKGLLLQLLSFFVISDKQLIHKIDCRILLVVKYINENFNKKISLYSMADLACLNKEYLVRFFKKNVGVSPFEYLINKRIENAQLFLNFSNLSLKEIAMKSGFDNYNYFLRMFKKKTMITPWEYKNQLPKI